MSASFKICPICETPNHPNAQVCTTCGSSLDDVEPVERTSKTQASQVEYDFRYGETDLLENSLNRPAQTYLVVAMTVAVMLGVGFIALLVIQQPEMEIAPSRADEAPTYTSEPMLFATVTEGPPTSTPTWTPSATFTPSITPTPEPCRQQIVAGSSLIAAAMNCGHRDQDVIPLILELNGLENANSIQAGQEIFIPWPTATEDPNAEPTFTATLPSNDVSEVGEADNESSGSAELAALGIEIPDDPFAPTATATLPPGVMWHTISSGENIASIVVSYDADVKTLSELNPQIDFARCEFGERFGGPDCLVMVSQGQLIRVPAPTPTPTLSPTADPNSTATPTATATFNVPNAVNPPDRAVFDADEIITLRWVPTASLAPGDAYRIEVTDITSGIVYAALTTDIAFTIPADWQGQTTSRHDYTWSVGIVPQDNPDQMQQPTEPRTFTWMGNTEITTPETE